MYDFYLKIVVRPHPLGRTAQFLLTMKLTVLIIFAAMLQVSANTFAQKITLNKKKAVLMDVLQDIRKQSGYDFVFTASTMEKARPVDINVKAVELNEVLKLVFARQPLDYSIRDKSVVVSQKVTSAKSVSATELIPVTISGKVTDTTGAVLPSATVKNVTQNTSTFSGQDGTFNINAQLGDQISISFIGYQPYIFTATDNLPYQTIVLHAAFNELKEVVVNKGYYKETRELSTGNVSTVTAKDIENQPVSNILAALEGRVPGMSITQTSGVPGSSFNVQIQGQSVLDNSLSNNDPLIIIDNVPFEQGIAPTNQLTSAANNPTSISSGGLSPLNSINPADIESVEVLKDADATAIYGSRGANGVILITTKKGKVGATKVSLTANSGLSNTGRMMPMLNTQQYIAMRKEAFSNDGLTISSNPSDPGYAPDLTLWNTTRYTDFEKLLIGNTAHTNDFQGSISGGNINTQFMIAGGYQRQTTVYPGDFADGVAAMHFSINHTSTDKRFTLQLTGMYSSDKNTMPSTDLTRYINLPPNLKLRDSTGNLAWQDNGVVYNTLGNGDIINPLSLLQQQYTSVNENLLGNLQLSYKIVKGLVFRTSLGYNVFHSDETSLMPSTSIDPNSGLLPSSSFANSVTKSWIIEPQLEYTRTTANDKLSILLGNTFQDKSGQTTSLYGSNYDSDLLLNSIAAAGNITASNDFVQYRYTAFFARINYNLKDKYIFNLTGRRDGSSRFAPDRQWANFGAAGAAWIFSSESFIKDNLSFLSFGKLRSSYGVTGNDQIGDYKFLDLWTNTANTYNGLSGLYPQSLYNPNYSWEINKKLEIGIDLGFLKDDILLSASWYSNRSDNQLISYSLPSQTGFFNVVKNFPGLVSNTGLELVLATKNIHKKDFSWTTSFNITIPKNELLAFPGLSSSSYASQYVIGQSLHLIYALKYTGVDPQTGLYTFEDKNKDGQLTSADYQVLGNTDPKFYGGLQNNISYKQFDLSFFFEFRKQMGFSYLNQLATTPPGWIYNQPEIVESRWQQPGDHSSIQQFTSGYTNAYTSISYLSLSNGIYTNASYIRLKNISLSYRLPAAWINKYHISNCRLFLQAQNLLTITKYVGSDPETQNLYVLPPLRTIVGGLQLNF